MSIPIAIQLYTARDALKQDFDGVVKRIAAMGYLGVEPFGIPSENIRDQAKLYNDLGLQVPSAHGKLPLGDDKNEVLDNLAALGCPRLVLPSISPEEFESVNGIKRACDRLNEASAIAQENGVSIGYHNHWWEFVEVEGRLAYDIMQEHTDPTVFFQLDTYWAQVAGHDAAELVSKLGSRAPLLHIKDGPITPRTPHVAVGTGNMDISAVIKAGEGVTEWLIVELDECGTDLLEAVEQSYRYLVREKLGRGNQG